MSAPEADAKDVLASLPRSRRQRPTARREAARAQKAGATKATGAAKRTAAKTGGSRTTARATGKATAPKAAPRAPKQSTAKSTTRATAGTTAAAKPAAKRPISQSPKRTSDLPRVRPPRSAIPPAGYATPVTDRGDHGTADPGAALGRLAGAGASALRGVLKRLPL